MIKDVIATIAQSQISQVPDFQAARRSPSETQTSKGVNAISFYPRLLVNEIRDFPDARFLDSVGRGLWPGQSGKELV